MSAFMAMGTFVYVNQIDFVNEMIYDVNAFWTRDAAKTNSSIFDSESAALNPEHVFMYPRDEDDNEISIEQATFLQQKRDWFSKPIYVNGEEIDLKDKFPYGNPMNLIKLAKYDANDLNLIWHFFNVEMNKPEHEQNPRAKQAKELQNLYWKSKRSPQKQQKIKNEFIETVKQFIQIENWKYKPEMERMVKVTDNEKSENAIQVLTNEQTKMIQDLYNIYNYKGEHLATIVIRSIVYVAMFSAWLASTIYFGRMYNNSNQSNPNWTVYRNRMAYDYGAYTIFFMGYTYIFIMKEFLSAQIKFKADVFFQEIQYKTQKDHPGIEKGHVSSDHVNKDLMQRLFMHTDADGEVSSSCGYWMRRFFCCSMRGKGIKNTFMVYMFIMMAVLNSLLWDTGVYMYGYWNNTLLTDYPQVMIPSVVVKLCLILTLVFDIIYQYNVDIDGLDAVQISYVRGTSFRYPINKYITVVYLLINYYDKVKYYLDPARGLSFLLVCYGIMFFKSALDGYELFWDKIAELYILTNVFWGTMAFYLYGYNATSLGVIPPDANNTYPFEVDLYSQKNFMLTVWGVEGSKNFAQLYLAEGQLVFLSLFFIFTVVSIFMVKMIYYWCGWGDSSEKMRMRNLNVSRYMKDAEKTTRGWFDRLIPKNPGSKYGKN